VYACGGVNAAMRGPMGRRTAHDMLYCLNITKLSDSVFKYDRLY